MRLGGYARARPPWWADAVGQKALIVSFIVAAHLGVAFWWADRGDAQAPSGEMEEHVTYYDIGPLPAGGGAFDLYPVEPEAEADSADAS